jgi:hypothetical protein
MSSIDGTMNSNHVLQEINGSDNKMPAELYTLLYMNRTSNKRAVAREKVIQRYKIEEINLLEGSKHSETGDVRTERID